MSQMELWRLGAMILLFNFCGLQAVRALPPDNILPNQVVSNGNKFSVGSVFEQNRDILYDSLIRIAPQNGSAVLTVFGSFPNATVYGQAECYSQNCTECLTFARNYMDQNAAQALGAQFWVNTTHNSCYLRYEDWNFIPGLNRSSDSIFPTSPLPATPPQAPPPLAGPPSSHPSPLGIIVGVPVAVIICLFAAFAFFLTRRCRNKLPSELFQGNIETAENFDYHQLKVATGGFSYKNKLGQGGFGAVYKGVLKDGSTVAVKQLALSSKQGQREFVNEISIITGIQHKNLVKLRGYCMQGDKRLLVYEFLENKSLNFALFDHAEIFLDWPTRFQIVCGVANGLAYLHEGTQRQIIHRDIKASNILLDHKLNPKISDFGISKLFNQEKGFTSTGIMGTPGYLAPEYVLHGILTAKADVFSFGMLVLEIVSGKRCNHMTNDMAWRLNGDEQLLKLADDRLDLSTSSTDEILKVARIALACTYEDPSLRASMTEVAAMLAGYKDVMLLPRPEPWNIGFCRTSFRTAGSNLTTSGL